VARFANNYAVVEEKLATVIDKQLAVDSFTFTTEMKGDKPLSLGFNAFGMSAALLP